MKQPFQTVSAGSSNKSTVFYICGEELENKKAHLHADGHTFTHTFIRICIR